MNGELENKLMILSGRAGRNFSERVVKHLKETEKVSPEFGLGKLKIGNFPNRELNFTLEENVRKKTVYVIQSVRQGPRESIYLHEDIFEVFTLNDLLMRAGARDIVNIWLNKPYLRQDRKADGREPIGAKLMFNLSVASAGGILKRVVVGDMHNEAGQGLADIPIDNVPSSPLFLAYYKNLPELYGKDVVIVSPDVGGVKRARNFAKMYGAELAIIDKLRKKGEEAETLNLIGDVKGKYCILIDDMIDTGGSLINAGKLLKEKGAVKIYACATHGLFDKKGEHDMFAEQRFYEAGINVLVTDTIMRDQNYRDTSYKWLNTVSFAPMIGDVIYCDFTGESVSSVLKDYMDRAIKGTLDIDKYLIKVDPKEIEL